MKTHDFYLLINDQDSPFIDTLFDSSNDNKFDIDS